MAGSTAEGFNIGLLMYIPYRHFENRVFAALAEAGFDDVTVAQMKILQRIGHSGTRLTDLAEQAQVTKQTAGYLVDQLEKAGLVERVPDPSDKRARLVRMSERALKAVPVAQEAGERIEAEWAAHLGAGRMADLRAALVRLREITDPYA